MLSKLCLLISALTIAACCPSRQLLHPCVCESPDSTKYITCDGIDNDQILLDAVHALKGVRDIYSLTVENAILSYIPHNLFQGVQLVELEFKTSSLMAFTDTDVAFLGLEDSLEILLVTECSFMNAWDWSLLKHMKKLMRLDIIRGDMESIDEEVREISNLNMKDISFAENKISHIYEHAFANFTGLQFVSLGNNLIKVLKRSIFPNPALALTFIDLGYNEINQLPSDMFENMPSLESISIAANKLLTLNEQTFSPIWEHLEDFQAMNNKLRCDCRMSWILNLKMPPNMRAICDQPQDVKGKNLNSLTLKDLWC